MLDVDTRRALVAVLERKFNLNQLRDPGGEGGGRWIKNPASGVIGKLADKLGLATKKRNLIQLADGEELVGSDVFKSAGGVEFLLAATRRADGSRTIRMATGVEDKADWGANNRGGTAVLDERGVGRLRNELDRMGEAEKEFKDEYKTAEKQYEEAKTTQYQLMRQKHPDLAAHQWHEIEDLDDDIQGIPNNIDMINDRIDERAGDLPSELYDDWLQLEAELAKLAPDSPARAALYDRQAVLLDELPAQRWGSSPGDGYRSDLRDLAKNQERLDYAVARRRDLLSLSMAELSAADTDALDEAETVRNDAWAEMTGDLAELTLVDGTVSGDWTNVGFLTDTDEQGDVRHHVEVRPTDAPDDWYPGYDGNDPLTSADLRKLSTKLAQMITEGGDVEPTASRTIPYDPPHAPAGSPTGGQFTTGGGGSKGKPQPRGRQSKTRPRKRAQPGSVLAYDPKTNQGTGYGSKNGDERVHTLQQGLNKFGITDGDGKELRDDGKLGPKTTAAVKKLQKALGLTPNGKVTPAMLQLLKTADSMAALKKAVAAAKGAKKPMPARTYRSLSRSGPLLFDRTFVLDDIQISRSGDGRTVEAYAAMFGSPYEVRDEHGHYYEVIDRSAFNRTLNGAGKNAMCLYNHGMTVHGTPSELGSVPLGTPLEIKPDGKGLLTVTRYNKGPFADQVLESIRNGDIKAQSFRGRIVRSDPSGRIPRSSYGRPLPTVTRHELGLTDYGPTPVPVNDQAEIVAVRSVLDLIDDFASLSPDERDELLRHLDVPTLDGGPGIEDLEDLDEEPDGEPAGDVTATSDHSEPGTEEPPAERSDAGHSGRFVEFRRHIKTAMVIRGM